MADALSDTEIEDALERLPAWRFEDNALRRELSFSNHPEAIAFLVRLAFYNEAQEHHPEVFNVWAHLRFCLRTHDAGDRVTEKDVRLAKTIDMLLGGDVER